MLYPQLFSIQGVSRAYTIDRTCHMRFKRDYRIISVVARLSWHLDDIIEFVSRNCSVTITPSLTTHLVFREMPLKLLQFSCVVI